MIMTDRMINRMIAVVVVVYPSMTYAMMIMTDRMIAVAVVSPSMTSASRFSTSLSMTRYVTHIVMTLCSCQVNKYFTIT